MVLRPEPCIPNLSDRRVAEWVHFLTFWDCLSMIAYRTESVHILVLMHSATNFPLKAVTETPQYIAVIK